MRGGDPSPHRTLFFSSVSHSPDRPLRVNTHALWAQRAVSVHRPAVHTSVERLSKLAARLL